MMKTYYVTYKIDARYIAKVEAESIEDALKEAAVAFESANLGDAEDIDGEPIVIEDEKGDYVWEA